MLFARRAGAWKPIAMYENNHQPRKHEYLGAQHIMNIIDCKNKWKDILSDDSGPYISIILPFGKPPIPSAKSKLKDPVDIDSTAIGMGLAIQDIEAIK